MKKSLGFILLILLVTITGCKKQPHLPVGLTKNEFNIGYEKLFFKDLLTFKTEIDYKKLRFEFDLNMVTHQEDYFLLKSYGRFFVKAFYDEEEFGMFSLVNDIDIIVPEMLEVGDLFLLKTPNLMTLKIKSSDETVLKCHSPRIKALKEGEVDFEISFPNLLKRHKIKVVKKIDRNIEVNVKKAVVFQKLVLDVKIDHDYFYSTYKLEITDPSGIKFVGNRFFPVRKGKHFGKVFDTQYRSNPTCEFTFEVASEFDFIFSYFTNPRVYQRTLRTYGNTVKEERLTESATLFLLDEITITDKIIDVTPNKYTDTIGSEEMILEAEKLKAVRSGIKKPETKMIVYHDTGNNTKGADAENHSKYIKGKWNLEHRARSWHYTVDDKAIYQHIPDDEVTWHGDNKNAYLYSIGQETCVDEGSDLFKTWHHAAWNVARLLEKFKLNFSDLKTHFDMSGKNCPQTLRRNALVDRWVYDAVLAELFLRDLRKTHDFKFISLNEDVVLKNGRVKNYLKEGFIRASFVFVITDKETKENTFFIRSTVVSKDNFPVTLNAEATKKADAFSLEVVKAFFNKTPTSAEIDFYLNKYEALSEEVKMVSSIKHYLLKLKG